MKKYIHVISHITFVGVSSSIEICELFFIVPHCFRHCLFAFQLLIVDVTEYGHLAHKF